MSEYSGLLRLVPQGENREMSPFTFSTFDAQSYQISTSNNADFKLSEKLQNVVLNVRIDATRKVIIENASSQPCDVRILVDNEELKVKQEMEMKEKMTLTVGPYSFVLKQCEMPSSSMMVSLLGSAQCSVCLRFLENARSLSCQHMFCKSCLDNVLRTVNNAAFPPGYGIFGARTEPIVRVSCPVCRKQVSSNEAIESRVLSEVGQFFKEFTETRPVCSNCANSRWISHPNDYRFCETCKIVLCPLCALNFHRPHELRANKTAAKPIVDPEIAAKCAEVFKEWAEIKKQVEETKEIARNATTSLEGVKNQMQQLHARLSNAFQTCKAAYQKVQSLESSRFDDQTERERADALKVFDKELATLEKIYPVLVSSMNKRAELIKSIKQEIDPTQLADALDVSPVSVVPSVSPAVPANADD